jgi:hypothetical protein
MIRIKHSRLLASVIPASREREQEDRDGSQPQANSS